MDFSIARLYHMLLEATLLIAHMIILPARTDTVFDSGRLCDAEGSPDYQPPSISPDVCTLVSGDG